MCKYCEMAKEDRGKKIFNSFIDFGKLGERYLAGFIYRDKDDKYGIELDFARYYDDERCTEWLDSEPINYCPMCGRKLGGANEEPATNH